MRPLGVMPTNPLTPSGTTSVEESWIDANERALAFCHAAQWSAAAELWTAALAQAPSFAMAPDTHALLLSNLAQALFRTENREGAAEMGRRSLAARLLCCDSDGDAPIARARADLAVYLTASGQTGEAFAMLDRARQSLELHYGDEDPVLASVLENLARLALITNEPANAEPLLMRLHALLDTSGDDPSRIEPLLARVAWARSTNAECDPEPPYDDVFPSIVQDTREIMDDETHPDDALELIDIAVCADDAIELIDVMTIPDVALELLDVTESAADEFELIDDVMHAPMSSPSAQSIRSEGLIEPGSHTTPSWTARTNPLGFEIQYGVPADESYAAPPHVLRDE